ncbi:MAG: hypothetical protein ABS95_01115, partial [Verrucomicrobia bacterium SCN 57-15]
PLISNNIITRTNTNTGGTITVYVKGIRVVGAGGGASAMMLPRVTTNWILGAYIGIEVINATSADVTNNTIFSVFTDCITANSNTIRITIISNRCFSANAGIRVNSLNGLIAHNYCESCATGIYSTQARLVNNQTPACTVPYGNEVPGIRSTTVSYTVTDADETILVDASGGERTISLPAAATVPGRIFTIKKNDNSANAVIVDPNAAETIDAATTKSITAQWQFLRVQSNGSVWFTV